MGDMLSQAEIDALLSGALSMDEEHEETSQGNTEILTPQEVDAIGEIGNISMGTSATTLYTLLGKKSYDNHAKGQRYHLGGTVGAVS
jgi:flagellar motor switch protein FliN/FliY